MDPRLQSVHLEAPPRRDAFRQARARVQSALGSYTIAGDLRPSAGEGTDLTPKLGTPVEPVSVCWLLDQGKQIPLNVGLNSIGRLPDNDIVIDDPTISRRHCAVVVHSDLRVELHDVASKNGTTINDRKLAGPTPLQDGDEICLCERKLIFVKQSGAATLERPNAKLKSHFSDEMTFAG